MDGTSGFRASYLLQSGVTSLSRVNFYNPPAFETTVASLDFPSTTGSFWPNGAVDNFAARFTADFALLTAGVYTFFLTSDDGSALYINGAEVILNDGIRAPTLASTTVSLAPGTHTVEVRYFEATGGAALDLDWAGPGFARTGFVPGLTASDQGPPAPGAFFDALSLPEDARGVPLAVLANDIVPPGAVLSVGSATHGTVRLVDGLPVYTATPNFTGADSFTYTLTGPSGATSSATVSLSMRPSHNQAQSVLDTRIAPEITPSGLTLEVARHAFIGFDGGGGAVKMNTFAALDDRQFVGSVGRSSAGNGATIHELIENPDGTRTAQLFFDIDAAVRAATGGLGLDYSNATHGGLRGIAFHPDFETNGLFYTSVMEKRPTNSAGHHYLSDVPNPISADSVLIEWRVNAAGAVDPASYREVFRIGMPVFDHTIRQMAFNPFAKPGDADYGLLYITHGDGSVQSATAGGGQNADALGKILRVDPRVNGAEPYRVPADNPFTADPAMLDEVYALGFRNPHNLSFAKGADGRVHLIVTDIGRDNFDEINVVVAGGNYGWSDREGPLRHLASGGIVNGVAALAPNDADSDLVYPAAFIGHDGGTGAGFVGQALAGGHVISNGSALDGQFIFGDFGPSGRFYHASLADLLGAKTRLDPSETPQALSWATPSELTILYDHDNDDHTPGIAHANFNSLIGRNRSDLRFGQGEDGELYITTKSDGWVYVIKNSIAPEAVQPAPEGLLAQYFPVSSPRLLSGINFDATPIFSERVNVIEEFAGSGAFFAGGPVNNFAARYTGEFRVAQSGSHTFYLTSDDGSGLWIDGVQVVANDGTHAARLRTATVNLTAGAHDIDLRYFEASGAATLDLDWAGPGFSRTDMTFGARTAPEILVSEDFQTPAAGWSTATRTNGGEALSTFLGRFAANQSTQKTFAIDPNVSRLEVAFDFYELDSWDGDQGDAFILDVNGAEVIRQTFFHSGRAGRSGNDAATAGRSGDIAWRIDPLTDGTSSLGFASRWSDQKHRVTLTIDDPTDALNLGFRSTLNSAASDESFGIDNLRLTALAFDTLV